MRYCFLLIFIFLSNQIFSQTNIGEKEINYLISNKKDKYIDIDKSLNPYKNDTIFLNRLLEKSKSLNNKELQLYVHTTKGVIYRDFANYNNSLKYHNNAIDLSNKILNKEFLMINLNMMGVVYRRLDSVQFALNCHQKALEVAESFKNADETVLRNIAIANNSLGNVFLTLNHLDTALEKFKESLELEKQINNYLGLAINYQNIGGIHEKKSNYKKALENYLMSLNYNKKINSELGILICNNSIGHLYLIQKNKIKAQEYLKNVEQVSHKINDKFYIAISAYNLALLNFELNNLESAKHFLNEAILVSSEKNFLSTLIDSYLLCAKIEERQGNINQSNYYLKKYIEVKDKLLNEKNLTYISQQNSYYESERKKDKIELLSKENQIVTERLKNNYKNYLFIALIAFLIFLLLFIYNRQRNLKSEKKLLQIEQKMLRTQMNPHFIFNSLNSIKTLIIKSDKENAIFYLNKFSKLVQVILSGDTEKEVSLKGELKITETYINIENMRLSNSINYFIDVDEEIDAQIIKLPSLLLQPFVENAIWHGLTLKEGEKNLKIIVKKQNKRNIKIIISDNGIGREAALQNKKNKQSGRDSLGIKITNERLKNYYQKNYSLSIIDNKEDKTQRSLGTSIEIIIPLNL